MTNKNYANFQDTELIKELKENRIYIFPDFHPDLNYEKIHLNRYLKLIDHFKKRTFPKDETYSEKHHILPRSLGGSDDEENLIKLTAREHFIVHLVLWKTFHGPMTTAFRFMTKQAETSSLYEQVRKEHSKYISNLFSGVGNPMYGRCGEDSPFYGIPKTEEHCKKLSKVASQRTGEKNSFYGKHHSEETRKKISEKRMGQPAAFKGRKHTEETKRKSGEKIREYYKTHDSPRKGKYHTEEAKKKLSEAAKKRTGEKGSFYGKTHTEEVRKRISEKNKKFYEDPKNREHLSKIMTEKYNTPEYKKILSEAHKGLQAGEKNPMYGKKHSEETRRKLSEKAKARPKRTNPLMCIETGEVFLFTEDAMKRYDIKSGGSISTSIKYQKPVKGYTFKRITKEEYERRRL